MSKIVFVGDTHGDHGTIGMAFKLAIEEGATRVVSVGDWGSWPGVSGERFRDFCSNQATLTDIPLYICRGNHDWPGGLEYAKGLSWQGNHKEIAPNLFFLGRTGVWNWDDCWFAVCGGAYSIDKSRRREGISWWPEEKIKYSDLEVLETDMAEWNLDYVDLLIAHDSPSSLPIWPGFAKDDKDSNASRHMIDNAHGIVRPNIQISGHYHRYITWKHGQCVVHSLSCDPVAAGMWSPDLDSLAVYDTETKLVKIVNLKEVDKPKSISVSIYPHIVEVNIKELE